MKKKVLLVTLLVVAIVASCFAFTACNKDKGDGDKGVKVAMITDYGEHHRPVFQPNHLRSVQGLL